MILRSDRLFFRLAVIAALAVTLAGCGRKGPLDLPPGAAASDATTTGPQDTNSQTLLGSMSGSSARTKPVAPAGPNKRIPLDALLN